MGNLKVKMRIAGEIMDLLTELNKQGTIIVVVTHDATVAAQTKRIINMQDGVIVEAGSNL